VPTTALTLPDETASGGVMHGKAAPTRCTVSASLSSLTSSLSPDPERPVCEHAPVDRAAGRLYCEAHRGS